MTRGIRDHNPGNLEDDGTNWEGLDSPRSEAGYLRFTSAVYGIRAMARSLTNAVTRDGIPADVADLITHWAPPPENDTAAYIADVAQRLGVDPTQLLTLPQVMPDLIKAIIHHENGLQPYDDATIAAGINLA